MASVDKFIVHHPLVAYKLGQLRPKNTPPALFRQLTRDLAVLLGVAATADLALVPSTVYTYIHNNTYHMD